ncbi:MAG: hypothetical protein R2705_24525 [Ilumatobacteraceae bacterium]
MFWCSPSEGAAAIVLASDEKAKQLNERAVRLRAVEFRTRKFGTFEVFSPWLSPDRGQPIGVRHQVAFETADWTDEIDVAQLQDMTEAGPS